jgi:hypothetical protein
MHWHWLLLAALAAGVATAQTPSRPDPADSAARVSAPTYRSALEGYRRIESGARPGWREANDETARIGGHIGILRERMAREKAAQGERK